jgi:hypothetical protein
MVMMVMAERRMLGACVLIVCPTEGDYSKRDEAIDRWA